MSFFIFTGALISGAIFIAHYAANRFGFRLFYSSLVVSALLALVINFVIISMKEVSSPESIGKIFLAVLLSAAAVTAFNDFLTRLEKKKLMKKRQKAKEEIQPEEERDNTSSNEGKLSFIKKLFSRGKKKEVPEKPDLSGLNTLDAILDFAYDARLSGRYADAVAAYEEAIKRYENDAYLPFIFIDLGNAHKETGEYDAAIDVYEKAVNMEVIKKDIPTVRSFEDNTIYLKALKVALKKRKMEHTPFSRISKEILDEVDEKVKYKEEEHEEKQ